MSNLRIMYDNAADRAVLSAPAAPILEGLPISNLKSNKRTKIWRTPYTGNRVINAEWASPEDINCVVLGFTNILAGSILTYTLKGTSNNIIYTSSVTLTSRYSNYIVMYLPAVYSAISLSVEIEDTTGEVEYLEISRLVIGKYWSPKFNTGFGMAISLEDSSTVDRADSGDLIIVKGVKGRKISFELPWMNYEDRDNFNNIINNNGKSLPVFASLFPNDADKAKEGLYEIFGPLNQDTSLIHSMHTMYSGRLEITEI